MFTNDYKNSQHICSAKPWCIQKLKELENSRKYENWKSLKKWKKKSLKIAPHQLDLHFSYLLEIKMRRISIVLECSFDRWWLMLSEANYNTWLETEVWWAIKSQRSLTPAVLPLVGYWAFLASFHRNFGEW